MWLRSFKRTRQGTHEAQAEETACVPLLVMDTPRIPTSVYAEMTPNPAVMKFVADRALAPGNVQLEFRSKNEAALCSPLATELFNFPFVTNVFVSGPMVSVTKDDSLGWEMIVQQLREYIREWLMDHQDAVVEAQIEAALPQLGTASPDAPLAAPAGLAPEAVKFIAEEDIVPTEHDEAISQLLEEFVRPAVEQDGGAIDFKAFKDGTVYVHLRGACSGCPSSMQTLKGGIEQLLKAKLDAVEEVVALGV
jgi:Fe-S cluster biogenesis protein NfuA